MRGVCVAPVKENLSLSALKAFGTDLEAKDFSDFNAVLVFVISHGMKGDMIVSSEGDNYQINDLVTQFIYMNIS
jgi:hypothetical protein